MQNLNAGHDNGNVVLWDISHVTPQRLSVLSCGCKALVTSIHLQEATGLLAAGHSTGEVRCKLRFLGLAGDYVIL